MLTGVFYHETAVDDIGDQKEALMAELDQEISAFVGMREDLEAHHKGKWVVVYGAELAGVFDSFDHAAAEAVRKFGRGPYLIRQVGAPPVTLPASVMYHPVHAAD